MDKPISFSGYKRYVTCPRYYKFHDIDKDRPGIMTSPLVVGSIMDEVVNTVLTEDVEDPQALLELTAEKWFLDNPKIVFQTDDFDQDLCDIPALEAAAKSMGWKGKDVVKALKTFLNEQENLSSKQQGLVRLACRESLDYKMRCMLEGFMTWIYPKIDHVIDVQKHITSKDGTVHGYIDFTAVMLKDGRKVLFDLKTAKTPYEADAVLKSPQLALYCGIEGFEYAGFIVLSKTLNKQKTKTCKPCGVEIKGGNVKKCPKCKAELDVDMEPKSYAQMLINKMPAHNVNLTNEAIADTIKAIDAGHFPRNLNACFWMYGKPCPYVKKCWKK